jgi:hypothetical protein
MVRYNIVPEKLGLINPGAYRRARFACTVDGSLCQTSADKITARFTNDLWERYGVRFVASYDPDSESNARARREGQFISEYTRKISRGGYRYGYGAIKDVTDATAWRRYGIAGSG